MTRDSDDNAGFAVAAEAYDRFMGRYSQVLAPVFADFAEIEEGLTALDVGCGPGALTKELIGRLGHEAVSAVDPSPTFLAAFRSRFPGVAVEKADASRLPHQDDAFDRTLAQLVVHFMPDPVAGLTEMRRVTKPGGMVAACVWDHAGGSGPLAAFWEAAREIDPRADDESERPGTAPGQLESLMRAAGLDEVVETALEIIVEHPTFEEWWEPYTLGVGPLGQFVAGLSSPDRSRLRDRCRALLPPAPFEIRARAWAARGVV
jgi:SAM-dependent methyltransferase